MKPSPRQPQALLFLCHRADRGYIDHFKALAHAFRPHGDAYFIFDTTQQMLPEQLKSVHHFTFSLDSLKELGYTWLHDSLMPGHVHFPVLDFALKHRQYSHYWVVEYDVRLTGPWRLFFWWAKKLDADFIATHLSRHEEQPLWYWWPTYSHPDATSDLKSGIRFFGPLYRISRTAVDLIDSKLKAGYRGHQEVVLPTLLNEAGFSLIDLSRASSFGSPSRWSWYTRSRGDRWGSLKQSSMRYLPRLEFRGWRPFTFYHPIKSTRFGLAALLDYVRSKYA